MRAHTHWWCLFRIPRWTKTVVSWGPRPLDMAVIRVCPTCGVEY